MMMMSFKLSVISTLLLKEINVVVFVLRGHVINELQTIQFLNLHEQNRCKTARIE